MSGLVIKLGPKERVLINGAVIENGDKRSKISIKTPNANVLRLKDAIHPDERILVVDDVLATGGTAKATGKLVETLGGAIVGYGFMIEIAQLGGRAKFDGDRVESLTAY